MKRGLQKEYWKEKCNLYSGKTEKIHFTPLKYGAVIPNGSTDTGAVPLKQSFKGKPELNIAPPLGSITECARSFDESSLMS